MTTFYSDVQDALNNTPVELADSTQVNGRLRVARCRLDLEANAMLSASSDDAELFKLPKGARVVHGVINTNRSSGSATYAIGITGATGKYRAAVVFTATNTPTLFGVLAGCYPALTAEETVLLTVGTANAPNNAGDFVDVAIYYTTD